MSRLSLIWLIAFLLQTYCNRYSQAQNISQIKAAIERKRVEEGQIEQIRNKILKELVHDGAKIRSETLNRVEHPRNEIPVNREEIKTDFKNEIKTGSDQSTKSKFIVTIGVPACKYLLFCFSFIFLSILFMLLYFYNIVYFVIHTIPILILILYSVLT